jgi:copper chaperone
MRHTFTVPDMSCGHCKMRIEKALAASGLTAGVSVDLSSKTVAVDSDSDRASLAAVLSAAGYPPASA